MARIDNLTNFLTDVADSIRSKTGKSETIAAEDFDTEIESISGGANLQTKSVTITENGTTSITPDTGYDGLDEVEVITDVPSESAAEAPERDVNFYDYDGFRLYSYSKTNFLNLVEMPENPEHSGLIAQGWNYTLEEAKTAINQIEQVNIGQQYITSDGKTRIYIELVESERLSPILSFGLNGSATVDWGDGNIEVVSGTSTTATSNSAVHVQHDYQEIGKYIITIKNDKIIYINSGSSISSVLLSRRNLTNNGYRQNFVYLGAIKKIELGNNISLGANALYSLQNLSTITIPEDMQISSSAFKQCIALKYIVIPQSITVIPSYCFNQCYNLKLHLPNRITSCQTSSLSGLNISKIIMPFSLTMVAASMFSGDAFLSKIKFYNNITSVGTNAFVGCLGVKIYDFTNNTVIPQVSSNMFDNYAPSDYQILVPQELYNDWIAADWWKNVNSHIYAVDSNGNILPKE